MAAEDTCPDYASRACIVRWVARIPTRPIGILLLILSDPLISRIRWLAAMSGLVARCAVIGHGA